MSRQRWRGLLVMAALIVVGGWILYSRVPTTSDATSARAAPRTGFDAPALQTTTPNGEPVRLDALRGKVVALNFWATWCGPCRAEMPALQAVYEKHKSDGLVVLGVNQLEDVDTINDFLREVHVQFPIGLDEHGLINKAYQVRALPTIFFVDRRGVIRDVVYGGPMDAALLESKVAALLKQP